jgi:hypothetical protein
MISPANLKGSVDQGAGFALPSAAGDEWHTTPHRVLRSYPTVAIQLPLNCLCDFWLSPAKSQIKTK